MKTVGIPAINNKESAIGVGPKVGAARKVKKEMAVMVLLVEVVIDVCGNHWSMLTKTVGVLAIINKESAIGADPKVGAARKVKKEMAVMELLVECLVEVVVIDVR